MFVLSSVASNNMTDCLEILVSKMTPQCVERNITLYTLTHSLYLLTFVKIRTNFAAQKLVSPKYQQALNTIINTQNPRQSYHKKVFKIRKRELVVPSVP